MRLKPRTWFLISLLLFAAATYTWHYAEKLSAARHARESQAAGIKASALKPQHPPLVKTLGTNALAKGKSYRLSNTKQSMAQLLHNNHALILRNALIDTEVPVRLKIPAHLQAKGAPGSYLVQADRPLDRSFYAELKKAGASYVSYVPNNAALVQASPEQATNLAQYADVIAVLPYEPYYKLDGTLLPSAVEQQPPTNGMGVNMSVTTYPGQRDAALAALTQLGARLIGEDRSPFGPTLVVNVPAQNLVAIAQLALAQEVESYTPRRLLNDLSRVQLGVATNTLQTTSNYLGLSGARVTVNLNDSGVDSTHPDFLPANRLIGDFPGALTDNDGHGTHVAGIIAGNGSKSSTVTGFVPGSIISGADFRGKATNATLFVQTLDLGIGPYAGDAFLQENASSNLGPTNLISNNSWDYGVPPGQRAAYDMHSASYDAATRDAQPNVDGEQPLLFVFAGGNSGNGSDNGTGGSSGTINSPGTAKNVITVGCSDSPRFITNRVSYDGVTSNEVFYGETDNSNLIAWFSSCGNVSPGVEGTYGRFKPDVVAPGVFTISCRATNYVFPTNDVFVTDFPYTNQIILPGQTNIYPFSVPTDSSGLYVVVNSNALSPRPFPGLTILGDPFQPPTDILGTNFIIVTNFMSQNMWYFGIATPTNQPGPVNFDLNFYLVETNNLGDYYTVVSNMNNVLASYYRYDSGTSMSAGAISGLLALMQEYVQTRLNITNPSPALLKAMLINGSRSLGRQYDFSVNTARANEQGWGMPNLTNCIPLSMSSNGSASLLLVDQSPTNALATGQYQTYTINCTDSNAALIYPLRVTLVWTDPPGDPAAGVALVNNLDLTVVDASGSNVYIGNNFHTGDIYTEVSGPTNLPAGESDNTVQNIYVSQGTANFTSAGDSINNVQNVYINPLNLPINFPLTVTISGTRINVNAVTTQTNNIRQDYALVVSSDDPALTSSLTVVTNPIVTVSPVLVTVASNGVPLLHQRVGANEPNLYNYPAGMTNGATNQWHFFVFTNDQFSATNQATNVAITTFLPPDLSIPRTSGSADVDLYVSTNSQLTNLVPAVVLAADKSVGRTGTEVIIYSNSSPNLVYYIGVKSEDQQAADFGIYAVAQQSAFSSENPNGSITATATALPVFIPNAVTVQPALVFAFLINPNPLQQMTRRVTATVGIEHGNPSTLYGSLQHNGVTMVLNHDSGPPGGYTNTYDDLQENPKSGDVISDGPGSLTQFVDQPMDGLWLLTESDNALAQTGYVTIFSVTVDPKPPVSGFFATIGANEWFKDYVNVPNDATNMIISAIYENNGTNLAGNGPIGIYLTNFNNVNLSDFGSNNILPPGGSLTLGTNPPVGWPPGTPPLAGGLWYYGIHNQNVSTPVTVFIEIQFQESLTPNLVQNYTNNTPILLTTDGHTQSQLCISNGQQVVALQLGVRIADPNLDDLVLHLTSPQGTSMLLFEDRGGLSASNLGMTVVTSNTIGTNAPVYTTNYIYTVFTEDTNLTTTPIKFAPPPYAREVDIPLAVLWSNSFETVTNGIYTNNNSNAVVLEGWLVTNNVVPFQTTNGLVFLTNNEVGIVTDPNGDQSGTNSFGTNYLALTSGHIIQTFGATNQFTITNGFAISNGQPYQLRFYVKPLGITDWWPGDDNANDLIGTNNGAIPYADVTYDVGKVDRAFTFSGGTPGQNFGNEVDFGTSTGNFGTNDFTIDFWIKEPTNTPNWTAILEKRTECDAYVSELSIRSGPLRPGIYPRPVLPGQLDFEVSSDNIVNTYYFAGYKQINDGVFHHAAFTRKGTTLSIYVDGILDTNAITPGIANISNSSMFRAGQSICVGTDGSVPLLGDLDELSLYDRALSPAEIYAIYHAGSLGKYSTNSILPNFQLTIDGISTNNITLTNASGDWQLVTNSFTANSGQVTIEFSGNAMGVLLDRIELVQLPTTNYNNYYLPEEPLTPFVGENPLGCWTLDVWDTRQDSSLTNNGTLLSWTMQVTTSSTNAVLYVLTNRQPFTITNTNGMSYFAVDVPAYATYATNILTPVVGGPLTLYFDQTALPTGGLPGDVTLASGVQAIASTNTLSTLGGFPPLLPGQRYFLGVLNNSGAPAQFTMEVDFNGMTNSITPLTNAVQVRTNITSSSGPQYYSFVVPTNASMVTFQILNPTNGEVDLYAREGLPLPGPTSFDYVSDNAGTNDQFIAVTTNSVPVPLVLPSTNDVLPLTANTWYLAAYNVGAISNISYTIVATVVTSNQITYIQLLDGIPNTNGIASPGYPTNLFYYFNVTNSPAGIQFTVTNLTNAGNVELLADFDVLPTPDEFYSGSFNPGTSVQLIEIGTNSALTNLNGTWYLSVPNTSVSNVPYSIVATTNVVLPVVNAPLVVRGSLVSRGGGGGSSFTMYWTANPGQNYQIYVSSNLLTWSLLTNLTAQSTTASYTDPTPVQNQAARFFRVQSVSGSLNPPRFLGGSVTTPTKGFTMYWVADAAKTYEIDVSSNLYNWSFVTNVQPLSTTGSYTDPTPVQSQRSRFFRLIEK